MSTAAPERLELPIGGMTCASCAARVERKLNSLDGVTASVNYATEKAAVEYDPSRVTPGTLVDAVEQVGYSATLAATPERRGRPDRRSSHAPRRLGRRSRCRCSCSAMVPALQFTYWQWFSLALATPVVLWGGWPFHVAAWKSLRHATATMDTLVSLGTLAAWGWSVVALVFLDAGAAGMKMPFELVPSRTAGSEIYLEVAAVVVTFMLAGRYVEARAKRRAGAALRALVELGAKDASILDADGVEHRVPIEEARPGDVFVVRPGEKVATDGVVVEGPRRSTSRSSPVRASRSR